MGEQKRPPRLPFPEPVPGDNILGTQRVSLDLKQKFGRSGQDVSENASAPAVKISAPLTPSEDLFRKEQERLRWLEGTTEQSVILPESEVRLFLEAIKQARQIRDQFEARAAQDPGNRLRIYQEAVRAIEKYFDTLPIWKTKFSTESGSGNASSGERDEVMDSVYYVTPSNMSVRLKKSVLHDPSYTQDLDRYGLRVVLQRPAAHLLFNELDIRTRQSRFQATVQRDLSVKEFWTKEWDHLLDGNEVSADFDSGLVDHIDDKGFIRGVGARNPSGEHVGDRVNYIYFTR